MISGFMILKNALKQGYPFVESIASALPICDEFLISDGYSTDGTFEIVKQMAALNKKIRLFRYNWLETGNVNILTDATNALRNKCKFDYIFYVQANEIIPEKDVDYIKNLPKTLPEAHTFCFPFFHLMGNYKWGEEFRLRLSKNLSGIVSIGDAWALGPSKPFTYAQAVKSLGNPKKLLRIVGRGVEWTYANSFSNVYCRATYLPKPVFRYWSIFPRNFLEKSKNHAEMFGMPDFYEKIDLLKEDVDNYDLFWQKAISLFRPEVMTVNYPVFGKIDKEDHPKIMQDFISSTDANSYYIRKNILESISHL